MLRFGTVPVVFIEVDIVLIKQRNIKDSSMAIYELETRDIPGPSSCAPDRADCWPRTCNCRSPSASRWSALGATRSTFSAATRRPRHLRFPPALD